MSETRKLKFETLQLHAGQETPDGATGARAVPIYQTTSYVFDNCQHAEERFALKDAGNIYSRLTNPTVEAFEARMAALEGGVAALGVASGAAAICYCLQNLAASGGHIVASQSLYGGTYNLLAHTLPAYGISATFVNLDEEGALEAAVLENTKAIYAESLGNPNSNPADIARLAEVAHRHKIPLVIDNTFATPYLLRPIEFGADIVVHSATKFIGGHGAALGGVIVDGGTFNWTESGKFPQLCMEDASYHGLSFARDVGAAAFVTRARAILLRDMGATLSPFCAFLLLQGLETLSLRVSRHTENTKAVLAFLNGHPKVEKVNHPSLEPKYRSIYDKYYPNGAGSIFTILVKGGAKEARKFIDSLQIFSLLANVADAKSLVIHPASTTHAQLSKEALKQQGIYPNTVRLSIGLEHIDDILYDLEQALAQI